MIGRHSGIEKLIQGRVTSAGIRISVSQLEKITAGTDPGFILESSRNNEEHVVVFDDEAVKEHGIKRSLYAVEGCAQV